MKHLKHFEGFISDLVGVPPGVTTVTGMKGKTPVWSDKGELLKKFDTEIQDIIQVLKDDYYMRPTAVGTGLQYGNLYPQANYAFCELEDTKGFIKLTQDLFEEFRRVASKLESIGLTGKIQTSTDDIQFSDVRNMTYDMSMSRWNVYGLIIRDI